MAAKIFIERMMHRSSIAVAGETAATYALLKLIPAGGGSGEKRPMALNIALVLDVSGSMYEEDGTGISRLKRVQDAAMHSLEKLNPDDTLSVVAFGHNASVLLPPTKISEKEKIQDVIRKIDMFDVDPGGTAMDEGMALGMAELEKIAGPGRLSQVVVLTDGETSGEQNCKLLSQKATEKKINISLMGVGTDWKEALIKELATLSNGKWYYIDTTQKEAAEEIFAKEFESLASAGFTDVELHVRPMKDIKLKRVRMVAPEIKDLKLDEPEERHAVAKLGTLQNDSTSKYIVDLTIPKRPDGKYVVAQVEVTYDLGTGKRESSGMVPLEMTYTAAGHGFVNAEVMRHIDDIQLKEMSDVLQNALAKNDMAQAQKAAEQMEKKGEIMGKRAAKKTMLAKQVLEEMNVGGRVSKKTMLAASDAMRDASEGAG
jgi:Ca-activated chloride channel family protein